MDIKKHTCNICNKDYKTYKSMWHHKKNIHDSKKNDDPKMTYTETQNDQCMTNKKDIIESDVEIETESKLTENTICMYCDKKFSAYTHMRRHLKICKMKDTIIKENEELKIKTIKQEQKMLEMTKSLDELKKLMLDMMNKKCKMHPKTLQKMINSNNTNSHNNITINNNIKYIEIGDENLHTVFSVEEVMNILYKGCSALDEIVVYTHLNDKYPQFQNIIIPNVRSKTAYMYSKQLDKYILCDKNDILNELIDYRMTDLKCFYEDHGHKLNTKFRTNLEKIFLSYKDDEYTKRKCKEFNMKIYNQCNKDNIKYKTIENGD